MGDFLQNLHGGLPSVINFKTPKNSKIGQNRENEEKGTSLANIGLISRPYPGEFSIRRRNIRQNKIFQDPRKLNINHLEQ